ncbi:hypothetical protein SLE2022_390920 [Rubroshorea leprosula]
MGFSSWGMICAGLLLVLVAPFCASLTDPFDVMAVNGLYLSLGSPPLTGWVPAGGDPCGEGWQGVNCVFWNITELRLNGMNLGGFLDDSIANFESVMVLDLSNNHIGGSIPSNLPPTLRNFSLSGNQFSGSIPDLSMLSQLLDLSLNDNHLSDGIPDSFQQLTSLIKLDLSENNLSGQLPPSFGNMTSLTVLRLQNNKLSGKLDVLQDLPLFDLNVENNLFSGPIPPKLLNIPNFRKDGNPFNTTILAPPPAALPPFVAGAPSLSPSPGQGYGGLASGPCMLEPPLSEKARKFWTNERLTWVAVSGVLALVVLGACLLLWRCSKGRHANEVNEKHGINQFQGARGKLSHSNKSAFQSTVKMEKVPKEAVVKMKDEYGIDSGRMATNPKLQDEQVIDVMKMPTNLGSKKDHNIDMNSMALQLTVPALPLPPVEGVIVNPVVPALTSRDGLVSTSQNTTFPTSVFTIASLQQYTNSFSEENFIGEGMLGCVYRAELPDGKLLAIKKLDSKVSGWWNEEEFVELVSSISKLKHPNILELMGRCNEHGQRLLVYKYCRHGSLYDALHVDDEVHGKLTWDARVQVALGAARALQYLHEVCQPPIMHRNLKSSNVLLDDKFAAHISDCVLAPLSCSADQLAGSLISSGYGAPELQLGSYTCQSDVYSLGIVMLELLTGRKPFDRSRSRGEQSLVGWAIPRLHDIDALSKMVDASLDGAYPVKSLSRFADIISRCVQWEPGFRPPVSEIVQDLLRMI